MSDNSTFGFEMDSKVVIAILAVTVTTIAAIVCTKKYILEKKPTTTQEKRILRRKQRSMMRLLDNVEKDSTHMITEIKKVQGIILNYLIENKNKESNNTTTTSPSTHSKPSEETKTNENQQTSSNSNPTEEKVEKKEDENTSTKDTPSKPEEAKDTVEEKKNNEKSSETTPLVPETIQAIRIDRMPIEMKIKGLDEYLLRLLEQLDSLRPNALIEEARQMCEDTPELNEDIIPYIEHKIEKIKKKKKSLVKTIQKYLDNIDILSMTVSKGQQDIEMVQSVAKLWEENHEEKEKNV